jgi:hypothetical protein
LTVLDPGHNIRKPDDPKNTAIISHPDFKVKWAFIKKIIFFLDPVIHDFTGILTRRVTLIKLSSVLPGLFPPKNEADPLGSGRLVFRLTLLFQKLMIGISPHLF